MNPCQITGGANAACPLRILILGNAGAGKTTLARRLIGPRPVPILPLDDIAWGSGTVRLPREQSLRRLLAFIEQHEQWVVEGCYGDLIEAALPHCTELIFLNPGVEVCVARCRGRAWEPDKFASEAEQLAALEPLIAWVRQYETLDDEFGLTRHRAIFDRFPGPKREITAA